MNTFALHKDFMLNERSFRSGNEVLDFVKPLDRKVFLFLTNWFDKTDVIAVHTSGSTGTPKQIQLKKQHMINSAVATGNYFELFEKTRALMCLPVDFIAGKMMLVRAMVLGWHLDMINPDSNPLQAVKKDYDFCAMVPLQLASSIPDINRIKKVIVGGGVVPDALIEQLQDLFTEIYATYGMTETITHIAVKKLNQADPLAVGNPCYRALPGVRLEKDQRDCLVIHAPKVSHSKLVTNDVVDLISETEFEWLGRYDNLVNSGGIKLIPEQIEKKLSPLISNRFFVFGMPDDKLGEKLILVIEGEVNSGKNEEAVVLYALKKLDTLNRYEIPKAIFFLPKFIETKTKKIQRQQTLDLLINSLE